MGNCNQKQILSTNVINHRSCDEFIIDLHHRQVNNGRTNYLVESVSLDQRRLVFISLIGLYRTWSLCPSVLLYSSIFVLPLKRHWVNFPKKYEKEIKQKMFTFSKFHDKREFNEFIKLLQWKDHQGLAFWTLDEYQGEDTDSMAPFWTYFSNKLTNLYDAVTRAKYKPIILDTKWWNDVYISKYNIETEKVLDELRSIKMVFKSVQEIIYQSNPNSLNPVLSYNPYEYVSDDKLQSPIPFVKIYMKGRCDEAGFVSFGKGCCPDIDDEDIENNEGEWMISNEYDEYDLIEVENHIL